MFCSLISIKSMSSLSHITKKRNSEMCKSYTFKYFYNSFVYTYRSRLLEKVLFQHSLKMKTATRNYSFQILNSINTSKPC